MSSIWMKPIKGPKAWKGCEIAAGDSWLMQLTPEEVADVEAAVAAAKATGKPLEQIERADFPLKALLPKMESIGSELYDGRGFLVVRGLPVQKYVVEDVELIFWGLGRYLGTPLYQNPKGDLLGHVYDHGRKYGEIDVRGYEGRSYLPYHTDNCDIVGLLCLRKGLKGGLSSIVSSTTVYNEILANHPEYMGMFYNGFYYIRREEALTGKGVSDTPVPVFGCKDGVVSCRYLRNQINAGAVKRDVPLTDIEQEALDYFDSLTRREDMRFDMDLQPGDMQLCNNYTILHSRTEFVDGPEPDQKRHMLRLWLKFPQSWPIQPRFPEQWGYRKAADQIVEA